ncbi:MAG: RND family transporter [Methanomicrobium sp.]|nr:RND family transporter [Methanomicrobium sp.]
MVVFLCVSGILISNLQMADNSEQSIDKSSPEGMRYDQYNNVFVKDSFVLLIQTSDIYDTKFLQALLMLEEEAKRLDYVSGTISVADILKNANGGVLPQNRADIERAVSSVPKESLNSIMPDSQTTLAYIEIERGISTDVTQDLVPSVESLVANAEFPPGVSIEITGNTPFNVQLMDVMIENAVMLIGAAFLFMGIVLCILFSNMRHWFLPIVLLMFGLIYTFAVMSLLGIKMGNGAIAAFPILLGLGIDYAVQFHARFDEEMRKGHSIEEANKITLSNTGPAVLYAMLATLMGFFAMFISPVPMIICFAQVAIIGVSCCYVSSLFGFPALVSILKYTPKEESEMPPNVILQEKYTHLLEGIVPKVIKGSFLILVVALVIAFSGIHIDPSIPIDTDDSSMAPTGLPAKTTLDKVQEACGSLTAFPLYVRGDSLRSLESVKWMDNFGTHMMDIHGEFTGVTSPATLVKEQNGGEMPMDQATLNTAFDKVPKDSLDGVLSGDNEAIISFSTITLSFPEQDELKTDVVNDLVWSEMPAGIEVYPTGDFDMYTSLMHNIADTKDTMTYLGFVLIFVFLALAYRKKESVTPLVPIVCVVGWNAVVMVLIGMHYNVISACLGSMTIGVSAEYTILVMERYLEEKKRCSNPEESIKHSVKKVGAAVTVSGLVTAGGFSALMLSAFPIISDFGLPTVICVIFSLVGAIVIMPATLSIVGKLDKKVEERKAAA